MSSAAAPGATGAYSEPAWTPPERRGPERPQVVTPRLTPGQLRRTSSLDILRPEGLDGVRVLVGRARDVRAAEQALATLDEARLDAEVDPAGRILRLSLDGAEVAELAGVRFGPGFRARAADLFPDARRLGAPIWTLLDDVPVATMISNYVRLHAGFQPPWVAEGRAPKADICAGWRTEGALVQESLRRGRQVVTPGPLAPPLEADGQSDAWHPMAPVSRNGARRRRRLDVTLGETIRIDAMFRDAAATADKGEDLVIHEYGLTARVAPQTLEILEIEAEPHVLPYVECPAAAASAQRLVGQKLTDLREEVRARFAGTSTCTHLNDALRSLEDAAALLRATP